LLKILGTSFRGHSVSAAKTRAVFDDSNLLSHADLATVMALAELGEFAVPGGPDGPDGRPDGPVGRPGDSRGGGDHRVADAFLIRPPGGIDFRRAAQVATGAAR